MEGKRGRALGYLFVCITVLVWGTTFISSKKLLAYYTPLQIMLTPLPAGLRDAVAAAAQAAAPDPAG
jgi:drug/metabolite transporter (DMT)-like permease